MILSLSSRPSVYHQGQIEFHRDGGWGFLTIIYSFFSYSFTGKGHEARRKSVSTTKKKELNFEKRLWKIDWSVAAFDK